MARTDIFLKSKAAVLAGIAAIAYAVTALPVDAEAGELTVAIERVRSDRGVIRLALCATPAEYQTDKDIFRTAEVAAERPVTRFVFTDIPAGRYAIKVYHDANGNDRLDRGFFGIPKERYGFSNDPKVRGGMPPFERAAFELGSAPETQTIRLR